jgi:hypothetical protein
MKLEVKQKTWGKRIDIEKRAPGCTWIPEALFDTVASAYNDPLPMHADDDEDRVDCK